MVAVSWNAPASKLYVGAALEVTPRKATVSPTLRIGLLGGFSLVSGDEPVTSVDKGRLQSLLAYLLLHRHAPQPRERLAFLLWPDTTEKQARTNLRRELHHLRRALPLADRFLRVDPRALQWRADSPFLLDVAEFEDAVDRADGADETGDAAALRTHLSEAADLYRGDLLPSCYERWIDAERERLRRACGRVLDRLIRACEDGRDHPAAIRHAERLVSHDPLRESSYARLIGLHVAAGDRAAALRVYAECEAVLERELGIEPGPATRQAREAAMAADAVAKPPRALQVEPPAAPPSRKTAADAPPLVGRERELAVVRSWIEGVGREDGGAPGQTLLLLGEPGIGKTRLLDELAATLRDAGGRTIRGRGFEAETVRPYGAWIDALRSVPPEWFAGSAGLGSLIPEIRGAADVPADRSRLFDAVAGFLARLSADGGPFAVLIDDIQWMDEASAALLHYLTRLWVDSPILVACAARPGELEGNPPVSGLVRTLEREGRVRTLHLAPMNREEIGALARFLDADVDGDRIFADSGGNPLFAMELARARGEDGGGERGNVEELIRHRLARLDEPARELLAWAAALGRSFNPGTLARVAEEPLPRLLGALEGLERHGILRPGETGEAETYDFAHDIVRRTAYAGLSGPRRRLVHLQIARALSQSPDPDGSMAGDVAHHASLGGDPALAASASVTAGERCLRIFAYAEAAELARRGIEHCRRLDDPERVHRHMALLRVSVAAGARPGRAADLEEELRALIADARSQGLVDEEAVGYSLLSVLNYEHDDFGGVHETSLRAAEALREVEPDPDQDPGVRARTLCQAGACLASIEREMPRAEALLLEAKSLAGRVGMELIDIPMGLGIVRHFGGDRDEAERYLRRALRMARRERDHFRACECLTYLVMLELEAGAPDRALAHCRELAPVAAKLKQGSEAPFARALDAFARYARAAAGAGGDSAATDPRDDAADDADATDPRDDDPRDGLARALDALRRMDASRKLAYVLTQAADVDLTAGRADAALERAEEALAAARVVDHRSGIALAGATLARSALALGEGRRAGEELDALRRELGGTGDLSARARAALEALETFAAADEGSLPADDGSLAARSSA